MSRQAVPIVLSISGHDPTGGAGIQADIEAIAAAGCRATSVVTCLTVQDSSDVRRIRPVAPDFLDEQLRTLLQDIPIDAIKIGLIGDAATARIVATLLSDYPDVPVVLDPILAAGGGRDLAGTELIAALWNQLLPAATLITPNSLEARRLTGRLELSECAAAILAQGCRAALITGAHEKTMEVSNYFYEIGGKQSVSNWPRLTASYHGSGCTLASSTAAFIARGYPLQAAVEQAQRLTWQALSRGYAVGKGQLLPNRLTSLHPPG